MQIDIISDTVCPWCFIGKRRLERALAERPEIEARITWRPFQLNPEMPREGLDAVPAQPRDAARGP
jgi:predicted DsbA family dithiol-disulfide isomerase